MQPKCSTSNANAAATATSNSVSTSCNLHSVLLIPPERFKEVCLRYGGEYSTDVNSVLEYLFDAEKEIYKLKADIDLLKLYLTGGISYELFKNKLKAYDNSSVCGLVWNMNYVAYRCRTCALSPCMSICAECFKNGDHQGHDFNMFRSGAGGACDCGDECVMNPKGFCKSHGSHHKIELNENQPPNELIKCCEIILSHLIYRLLQYFRIIYSSTSKLLRKNFTLNLLANILIHRGNYAIPARQQIESILSEIQPYLDLLNELCSLGTPLRKILVDYMISEEFYEKKIQAESKKCVNIVSIQSTTENKKKLDEENDLELVESDIDNKPSSICLNVANDKPQQQQQHQNINLSINEFNKQPSSHKQEVYLKAVKMQQPIKVPLRFREKSKEICELSCKNMVDEFLFWCIIYEFPENLVKYLLSLLPDIRYKQIFIKSFVSEYSYISVLLLNSKSEHLSSRVVHISVQLFSNKAIAIKALEESNLLPIILSTLYNMIVTPSIGTNGSNNSFLRDEPLLVSSKLQNELRNTHKVVDPDHPIMQENLYWLVISDLVNLLSHKQISLEFLNDSELVELWLELINYFQSMNLNIRKFGEHIQQEQPTYFSSFSAELEFCSSVMWSFLQHLKQPNQLSLTKQTINLIAFYLDKWLESVGFYSIHNKNSCIKRPNFKHLTFHLPLHRYFSSFLYNAIYEQAAKLDFLLDTDSFGLNLNLLTNILAHPLQLQIGFHEIHANMWVRNGMQMKGQAMTYVQNHFCTSFSDADLFLIQVVASKLDPSTFMNMFFERFHLTGWLKRVAKSRLQLPNKLQTSVNTMRLSDTSSSDSIVASVVEEMLDGFESLPISSPATNESQNENDPDHLEEPHLIAMLVGSLTVLAQIVTIKPNLCFKSYTFTRAEVVNLLCVYDRTYSQIEESLPDVCGLSSGKKFIEPILKDVADFLQPTLDSMSIGNIKQGRYKPKDSIWLNEYDPLYVMIRSVKRREFQESFDRYCQFIEKKFPGHKLTKNLWPPFRLPTYVDMNDSELYDFDLEKLNNDDNDFPNYKEKLAHIRLSKELNEKSRILNTKILHAILLTILYEHYYTSPVTEKVLYFVVYILELAIHLNQENKSSNMETEQKTSESDAHCCQEEEMKENNFDELNYETWYKSNDITENLCALVPFVTIKYEPITNLKDESADVDLDQSKSTDTDSTNQIAQSSKLTGQLDESTQHIKQTESSKYKIPPNKKICSGIPSMLSKSNSNLDSNSAIDSGIESVETPATIDNIDAQTSQTKTNKPNDTFTIKRSVNYESILSLLVKIFFKNKNNLTNSRPADTFFDSSRKVKLNKNSNSPIELKFLNKSSAECSDEIEENPFKNYRIGDENDFIVNLLEKAAGSCYKCHTNIEMELDKLNKQYRKSNLDTESSNVSDYACSSSESNETKTSPTVNDDLKNKKLKAKARQQKLLALMTSNQKAFLQNPNNKTDIEAYKEINSAGVTPNSTEFSPSMFNRDLTLSFSELKEIQSQNSILGSCSSDEQIGQNVQLPIDEMYDCCICRLTTISTPERPIGAVTLLQSTSVLGHRESIKNENYIKKLPINDEIDSRKNESETTCWKQEEKRVKNLREAFSLDSCKYSINIGWRGGVYAQMCGHYLHFDCYNSYKQTLDEQLTRFSNIEYACPLCRQVANCVLPVITYTGKRINKQTDNTNDNSSPQSSSPSLLACSLSNIPAKLWILSSLANKQSVLNSTESTTLSTSTSQSSANYLYQFSDPIYEEILHTLKTRPFSTPEISSKTLTQCKNDALAIITLTTPLEFRYIDHTSPLSNPTSYSQASPIDDDIAMFTTSVLRTQLEIDLMLKQHDEIYPNNFKKRRACFLPLFDVISTHCRLMCHELKAHVKQWLILTNPCLVKDFIQMQTKKNEEISNTLQSSKNKSLEVPILLKDPIACLLLVLVNLPTIVSKPVFNCVVSTIFNMVFLQGLIDLIREFDEEERDNWCKNKSSLIDTSENQTQLNSLQDYVSHLIANLENTNVLSTKQEKELNTSKNYFIKTIWTPESAKNYIETKCLHFLKIASLLQYYLYDQEVLFTNLNSFDYLIEYLDISYMKAVNFDLDIKNQTTNKKLNLALKWSLPNPNDVIKYWLKDLMVSSECHFEQVNNLLKISFDRYHFPRLLELPNIYSDLFGYFSTKKCQHCNKIPKDIGVCLLCGAQICYKNQNCCGAATDFNKKHLNVCGSGTLVIININTTYVLIVRGKRCAPWPSLYLDEHGEEDKDLRRGKPLYLNHQRYNLLNSTWLSHSFDYQSLKWHYANLLNISNN